VILKYSKVILILLILGVIFSAHVKTIHAEEQKSQEYYFDFIPESFEVQKDKIMEIKIIHRIRDLDPNRWKVKPVAEKTTIRIYNPEAQRWIFSNNSWLVLPNLAHTLNLKISPLEENVKLKLLIKDLETNEIYETPSKELFTTKSYDNYFEKINESVKTWRQTKQSSQY